MRTLDFIVSGQTLTKDPLCDFSGIAAGSQGYLFARFRFSKDWTGCKKAALFTDSKGKEYPVGLKDNMCEIPAEALTGRSVRVMIVGRSRDGSNIPTTETAFAQTVRR